MAGDFGEGLAPYATSEGWGYLDKEGNPVIPPRYDEARAFSEGRGLVRSGDVWGFIDKNGEEVIPFQFREARSFTNDWAAVRLNSSWTYLSRKTGHLDIDRQFTLAEPFVEGVARVHTGSSDNPDIGYIDRQGQYVWYPTN